MGHNIQPDPACGCAYCMGTDDEPSPCCDCESCERDGG